MKEKQVTDLKSLIAKDQQENRQEFWTGTFVQYLDLIKEKPDIARFAHGKIYDSIMSHGSRNVLETNDPRTKKVFKDENNLKTYNFFSDTFFGIERTIAQVVRYFHSASLKGEESRQVLYFMGPVGSGKSSLVERLKEALDGKSFYCLKGCPMREEPLHLVPKHLRSAFSETLGVQIEGDLCPVCRWKLTNELNGQYDKFPVETRVYSIVGRVGIGVVPPVDPNNQDTSVLIGSQDISKLVNFSEDDPRTLELSGAFNVGNRGMVEFIEVFKNETEYLHAMITATQEKVVPAPGRHGMIYVDSCIVAHSNEAEWQKFKADHTNEAILDRIVVVKVPYNLRLTEEVKIYQKMIRASDFRAHIAPHTLELASMFAILSRLEKTDKCDPVTKLHLYNGEEVVEKGRAKKIDLRELQDDTKREGLSGVSTRFTMKALDNALSDNVEGNCINPINVREAMINMIRGSDMGDDKKKELLAILQDTLHKEYLEILEKEITKAFVYAYQEQAETLFQNYLDHAEAFVNKVKVKDRNTNEELNPDEHFLKSIEEHIGIIGSSAESFRQEVISYMMSAMRRNVKLSYNSYEPLKEAIEKKLMSSVREISRIVTKARTRDNEQQEKYNDMVKNLLDNGYCMTCVDTILKYSANNLWRD